MYQASEVEQFAPGHHGYPRASEAYYQKDHKGPLWHPVLWLRRADRSSISSFHLADLGRGSLLNRSIFDVSLSFIHRGSGVAIPSEPPSLACPIKDWRARVAEREGVHSLGEPERAFLMWHWA